MHLNILNIKLPNMNLNKSLKYAKKVINTKFYFYL